MSEIDEALAAFGGHSPRLIKTRENAVYEAVLPEGRAAIRLHRPGYQSPAAIRSELDWMRALTQAGIAVPEPLAGPARLSTGRLATAVRWVDGAPLGDGGVPLPGRLSEHKAAFRAVGAAIARLHNATDAMDLPKGFDRHAWDIDGFLGDTPFWGRFWESPALTDKERTLVQHARAKARDALEAYRVDGADFGLIHADVLRENVLIDGGTVTIIDFDDAGWGFRLYDLATLMSQNQTEPDADALRDAAITGYRAQRPLSDADVALIPMFVMLRRFASMGWIVPRAEPGETAVRTYANRAVSAARAFLA